MMDQILLRRSDEHTPTVEAERIPSHLFDACAEASDIVPPPAFSRLQLTGCTPHRQGIPDELRLRRPQRGKSRTLRAARQFHVSYNP